MHAGPGDEVQQRGAGDQEGVGLRAVLHRRQDRLLYEHGDDRQPGVHLLVQASDGDDNDEDGGGGLEKECKTQMVTVCQPAQYGYGHAYGEHAYGENLCKEVGQETCYNVPVVTIVEPPVDVTFPEPVKACVNKPIALPRISCEDLSEEKCITVPKVKDDVEEMDRCVTVLADSDCQAVELTLPKQSCVELVYGYAETAHHNEPPPY